MNPAIEQQATGLSGGYSKLISNVRSRYQSLEDRHIPAKPFGITTPDGRSHLIGSGSPSFTMKLMNDAGMKAMGSFDELSIAEAFMSGDLDIEGEVLQSLRYRAMLSDSHPLQYL